MCWSIDDNPLTTLAEDLKASSVDKNENKPKNEDQGKKKKKRNRALKITNTHMKAFVSSPSPADLCSISLPSQGIDFSQDYEAPA